MYDFLRCPLLCPQVRLSNYSSPKITTKKSCLQCSLHKRHETILLQGKPSSWNTCSNEQIHVPPSYIYRFNLILLIYAALKLSFYIARKKNVALYNLFCNESNVTILIWIMWNQEFTAQKKKQTLRPSSCLWLTCPPRPKSLWPVS